MTDERLAELERLAAAAAPGPWWWFPRSEYPLDTRGLGGVQFGDPDDPGRVADYGGFHLTHACRAAEADGAFVASARAAVPELVAEVRRLRAAVAAERERCAAVAAERGAGFTPGEAPRVEGG